MVLTQLTESGPKQKDRVPPTCQAPSKQLHTSRSPNPPLVGAKQHIVNSGSLGAMDETSTTKGSSRVDDDSTDADHDHISSNFSVS